MQVPIVSRLLFLLLEHHDANELPLIMEDVERRVLDLQWLTPHLTTLGAVEISRAEYRRRLAAALPLRSPFVRT